MLDVCCQISISKCEGAFILWQGSKHLKTSKEIKNKIIIIIKKKEKKMHAWISERERIKA